MNKSLRKVPNRTRIGTALLQAAAGVMLLLAAVMAVASRMPMRHPATATSIEDGQALTAPTIDVVAALDVETAMEVTPEYRLMSCHPADSPQYRVLQRKARLRVTAAAQYVARQDQYKTVLCLPSSEVQDITERVRATMVTPNLDFFPVAELSTEPFTGEEVPLAA